MFPYQYQKPIYGDEIKVVKGLNSAKQYPLAPNSRTILMDADEDIFYLLQSDAVGSLSIGTYRFEQVPEPQPLDPTQFITKAELEEVLSKYEFHPKQQKQPKQSDNKQSVEF